MIRNIARASARVGMALGLERSWRKRIGGRLVILLYHGVSSTGSPTHIASREFSRQMEHIGRHHKFTTLGEALLKLERREPFDPKGEVVITFDDGYRNNFTTALPILTRHGVRPVVFMTAGLAGSKEGVWVDVLRKCVMGRGGMDIHIEIDGESKDYPLRGMKERRTSLDALKSMLKRCSEEEKLRVIDRLRKGSDVVANEPDDAILDWNELKMLSRDADIGSHGMTHAILTRCDRKQGKAEICKSKALLEKSLRKKVTAFAYPNGRPGDFDETHKKMLQDCGYGCALSTTQGSHAHNEATDMYALRRVSISGDKDFTDFIIALYFHLNF